jgi:hypothetical protein
MAQTETTSPVTLAELERLKAALLFTDEDVQALRRAHDVLAPRVEELLDVWYGFVGAHDFLLQYFSTPEGPHEGYLAAVRERFRQWVLDLTRADYDETWLSYQEEIGRRHYTGKNTTDGIVGAPEIVHYRYVVALVYPIYATVRPFLEQGCSDPAEVERMHQAWLKAVLLSVALWSHPYVREGAF